MIRPTLAAVGPTSAVTRPIMASEQTSSSQLRSQIRLTSSTCQSGALTQFALQQKARQILSFARFCEEMSQQKLCYARDFFVTAMRYLDQAIEVARIPPSIRNLSETVNPRLLLI